MPAVEMALVAEGLSKTYTTGMGRRPVQALDRLDLRVARGTVFGLLGPNGAGKTTLVKIALGIARATSGRAEVLGRPAGDVPVRARIGYLPENHRYPAHLTGAQVLHYFGQLSGIEEPVRSQRVEALLRRVRMDEWRDTAVRRYSKGMMQRLGMAQAILNEPDLLILDEPTDGVDPVGRREIRDLLLEQKQRGATIFLNSHLLSEVERLCDRVAILKEGRLVREGHVDDLTRGTANVWEIDVAGGDDARLAAALAQAGRPGGPPPVPGRDGARTLVVTGETADLDRTIDALRAAGLSIAAVRARRESLEDVFVKIVRDGEAA
ncbi:MAG TPA: ABC transporter ATP-binding protein [Candidatus Polarisedimenticolia bacterium]|nr:ABC transporter ATP-binding protein [Candidatus Polarisedimenticolia bacterium]